MRFACLVLLLFINVLGGAYAQDFYARIDAHQQQLERLGSAFLASQSRMLEGPDLSAGQQLAYDQLGSVHNLLTTINRELTVLTKLMTMELLVQGEPRTKQARRIVDQQKEYIVKRVANVSAYIEKIIPRVRDSETSRLLFEARDSIKATSELLRLR